MVSVLYYSAGTTVVTVMVASFLKTAVEGFGRFGTILAPDAVTSPEAARSGR